MEKNGVGVRKGAWTKDEDTLLRNCIQKFGEGKWHKVPPRAGLNRCRKSCRLRWLNYLRPDIKRGYFTEDEVDLVLRLHKLLGNRWSLIAGRIPGRTANDVKNFWNTHIFKKSLAGKNEKTDHVVTKTFTEKKILYKPRPRIFSKSHVSSEEENKTNETKDDDGRNNIEFPPLIKNVPFSLSEEEIDECIRCWLETADDEPTPVLFSDKDVGIMQPLFSPTEINQKIAEFSSLAIDDHLWDFTNFG